MIETILFDKVNNMNIAILASLLVFHVYYILF